MMKRISGEKGAAAIEQLQENWHDFNHGMIVGEYLWVSGMITGVAGLPDTVETLGIALNERGGVAVAGDLALGIINSVKETWTEFQDGDVKDKGRVIGRLIPDAILAGMAAVKGIKSFKAARLAKTETTATIKNSVETVEDLGEVGAVAKVGSTVEGVVADKVDDVVRSVVKKEYGDVDRGVSINSLDFPTDFYGRPVSKRTESILDKFKNAKVVEVIDDRGNKTIVYVIEDLKKEK